MHEDPFMAHFWSQWHWIPSGSSLCSIVFVSHAHCSLQSGRYTTSIASLARSPSSAASSSWSGMKFWPPNIVCYFCPVLWGRNSAAANQNNPVFLSDMTIWARCNKTKRGVLLSVEFLGVWCGPEMSVFSSITLPHVFLCGTDQMTSLEELM